MTPHEHLHPSAVIAEISEVFSSLQGEGPYLGKKQIFVRFGRCNMHCVYCDELEKMKEERFDKVSLSDLVDKVDAFEAAEGPHHSVSLTGGEPLFYSEFLTSFLPILKTAGYQVYLETNGTMPAALKKQIPYVDIIAMDLKPPSSTGDRAFWDQHREFLRIALAKKVFVKVVVTAQTTRDEITRCVDLVSGLDSSVPFIFQPESEATGISLAALDHIQKEFMSIATARLSDVRVIPQMHKIWGVR